MSCKYCGASGIFRHGRCSNCHSAKIDFQINRRGGNAAQKRKLIAERGLKCEECGECGSVEMHHKIKIIDGGNNSDDNLQLLCHSCHALKDRKYQNE